MRETEAGEGENGPCVFCEIVTGMSPSVRIRENAEALAFLTLGPTREGHTVVIPKRHAVELADATTSELASVFDLASGIARLQRSKLGSRGETLFLASGKKGEQSVMHLHLHLVPRHANDGLDLTGWWDQRVSRPPPADLEAIARRLRGSA